jgi:hypothetical protein
LASHDEPPPSEARTRATSSSSLWPLLLGALVLAALGGVAWWAWPPEGPPAEDGSGTARVSGLPESVPPSTCGECHPGEEAHYSRSGHANTLHKMAGTALARRLDGRTVEDPEEPGVSWTYALKDGEMTVERKGPEGKAERMAIDYAFGSGTHAVTFVSLAKGGGGKEHRLSVFAHPPEFDVTPGQEEGTRTKGVTPLGRDLSPEKMRGCFKCHTARLSARDPDLFVAETMVPDVTCERCHGPAWEHVEAARRGEGDLRMPFGPGRQTAEEQLRLCGDCHRHPSQNFAGGIRPDNPEILRFQPVGLWQSICYQKSAGKLSCVTCHDPHAKVSTDLDAYQAACLNCHRPPSPAVCKVNPTDGCLECHMPRQDTGHGFIWTDHWIRVRRESPAVSPASGPVGGPG